jgi:GNAT superfamily N-acetyltransferase
VKIRLRGTGRTGQADHMGWHTTTSAEVFLDLAGAFLRARPVENTLPLNIAGTLREHGPHHFGAGDPLFGWYATDGGRVDGAFLQTPPFPLLVTAVPEGAMAELAALLSGRPLSGVNALTADAQAFRVAWCDRTGARARVRQQHRLFRLAELTPLEPPAGAARVAGPGDRALLIDWLAAFFHDVGEPPREVEPLVDDRIGYGGMTLWEVDGTPVSMAGVSPPHAGIVRVVSVYTPPDHRGRGYGGAVTATVTRAALDAGADDVVLFTDLANPTSNALYQRLGYRPVEDRSLVEFTS